MRMSLPQEGTHSSRGLTYSGAGGPGGAMAPPIVETRRKIVNVVGNCQSCRREGGGAAEDLKCCPEKFLVCRKKFRFVGKVLPLPPPPKKKQKKNMGPTAPLLT